MAETAYRKPGIDQLARFACVRVIGPFYTDREFQFIAGQLLASDATREGWERHHREFQAALRPAPNQEGEQG